MGTFDSFQKNLKKSTVMYFTFIFPKPIFWPLAILQKSITKLMKLKLALITALLCFNASCQSAKTPEKVVVQQAIITPKTNEIVKNKIVATKKSKSSIEEDVPSLQGTDLSKVFAEAEKYFTAAKNWQKLRCEPKSGFLCTKRECPKREVFTHLILDKKAKTITRCEKDVCESFPAQIKQTGVFTNVQTEGPVGTLIRVLGDSRYKEITTVGLDAYIANGNCEVITE